MSLSSEAAMADEYVENWSGIEVFWDYESRGSQLTVGITGPSHLLRHFESPTEVMVAFMQAVEASDHSQMLGEMESIHTRFTAKGFSATWVGKAVNTDGRLPEIMNNVTRALGGREL